MGIQNYDFGYLDKRERVMDSPGANERVKGLRVCGENIRGLRVMRGLTQTELAKQAGYSERLVRKAEASGALSLSTIEDLAEALSCNERRVVPSDLCSFPEGIARKFVDCYDEHQQLMLDYCAHLLAKNFVFHCAGGAGSSVAGEWRGADGFQAWLDKLFSIARRPQRNCLQATYMTAQDRVTARYDDTFVAADQSQHVMWVNLHFTIRHGLIERIQNEFDTSLALKLEAAATASAQPNHPR